MRSPNLEFIDIGRRLEVEAIDGGRRQSELTVDPSASGVFSLDTEEEPVLFKSVDDVQEHEEEEQSASRYAEYAQLAFSQRGLTYPFAPDATSSSLEVIAGQDLLASTIADLARIVRLGKADAKRFEKRAFRALWRLIGGWGVSVGSPREQQGIGEQAAVEQFRQYLQHSEVGEHWPDDFSPNGDRGADGFIILGRKWGGPLVFFQCKNTEADVEKAAAEFLQVSRIIEDWFGKRHNQTRQTIRVVAFNTVLTLATKEELFRNAGEGSGMHILDSVDILCAEVGISPVFQAESTCTVL
jgi:hypothetical protein